MILYHTCIIISYDMTSYQANSESEDRQSIRPDCNTHCLNKLLIVSASLPSIPAFVAHDAYAPSRDGRWV